MPACARKEIVRDREVGVYHVYNRCVRRAFRCGQDERTGKDYEYRRQWICQMERRLAGVFGLDIGWHAEVSNHLHLILRTRPDVVETWSDEEVARRSLVINHLGDNGASASTSKARAEEHCWQASSGTRCGRYRPRGRGNMSHPLPTAKAPAVAGSSLKMTAAAVFAEKRAADAARPSTRLPLA